MPGRSTQSLDVTKMTAWRRKAFWKHIQPKRPQLREHPRSGIAAQWCRVSKFYLIVAIHDIVAKEQVASGVARVRLRARRLRAADQFKRRFGENGFVRDYSAKLLPWEDR